MQPVPWGGPIEPRPFVGPPAPPRPSQVDVPTSLAPVKPIITVEPPVAVGGVPVMIGQPVLNVGGSYVAPGWYILPNGWQVYVAPPNWNGVLPPRPPVFRPFPAAALGRPVLVNVAPGTALYAPPEQLWAGGANMQTGSAARPAQEVVGSGNWPGPGSQAMVILPPEVVNPGTAGFYPPGMPATAVVLRPDGFGGFVLRPIPMYGPRPIGWPTPYNPLPPSNQLFPYSPLPDWVPSWPQLPVGGGGWSPGMPIPPFPGTQARPTAASVAAAIDAAIAGDDPANEQGGLMRPFSGSLGIATAQ